MDNHQVCAICGRDTHTTKRCPKLRKRKCYECGSYDHLAQECRDRKAAQPEVTFRVSLDVEPFGPLVLVSIDDWAASKSYEELEAIDEWIASESAEDVLAVPPPSRKRQAANTSPQPGPSRRYRSPSRSPPTRPSNSVATLSKERPSYVDTHFHMDLLKRNGTKVSEWNLGGTDAASFGGAIACFTYPALYMDNIQPKHALSHYLRRYRIGQLLRDSTLIPRDSLLGGQYGCHPRHADEWIQSDDESRSSFYALRRVFESRHAQSVKPLAVGETGLDTFHNSVPLETQRRAFDDQIWVASEFRVPIVLHLRGPRDDDTVHEYEAIRRLEAGLHELGRNHKVHRHCFRHSKEMANEWLRHFPNTKFGITAKLLETTYAHEIEFATTFPLEHILLETDSPHCGSSNPTNASGWRNESQAFVASMCA
ncbi:Protein Y37H2A.1 b [Aphelenchoides avenae]|nr:Protein Y37H2A.1 b [Aphelenchus avenae]